MLYEMARTYDEYPDGPAGIERAGRHQGVLPQRRVQRGDGALLRLRAGLAARSRHGEGSALHQPRRDFRLRHVLYDYHAALNEAGALFVSAMVHSGWQEPEDGRIALAKEPRLLGAHAFAIVGYDPEGFYVLNSWGPNWCGDGRRGPGIGHWLYEDWKRHVLDAWVLRLAVPSENTFHLVGGFQRSAKTAAATERTSVPRIQINGHYVHVSNGRFVRSGNYWNDLKSFEETALLLKEVGPNGKDTYRHLLFYAHGGLNDLGDAVARIAVMTPVLKALKIYPIFFVWRTGFFEELIDVLRGPGERAEARVRGISDLSDALLETAGRAFVKPVWQEMKEDAHRAMFETTLPGAPTGEGWSAAAQLIAGAVDAGMGLHFVGHSAGAVLLGELLKRAAQEGQMLGPSLGTVSLFAPACTEDYFEDLQSGLAQVLGGVAPEIVIYNLTDRIEREDTVGAIYRKSLLYLVSNAFEDKPQTPILGLERVAARLAGRAKMKLLLADGTPNNITESRTHGGFDEDSATLNHVLNRILEPDIPIDGLNCGFASWMFQE